MERILLIGSGGREDALAHAMRKSAHCEQLFCAPGNPGIERWAEVVALDVNNHQAVVVWCLEHNITLVVIGPDQFLADGLADPLRAAGLDVFGPSQAAAKIEWSKSFAKDCMHSLGIPTAASRVFTGAEAEAAEAYVRSSFADGSQVPLVIKADGLAAGKGVIIAHDADEAAGAVRSIFDGAFGDAGASIVVEAFLQGVEASVFALTDGVRFLTLAPAQDHKRIGEGDTGKNTGGMGAYAPAPVVTPDVMHVVETTIIRPLLDGLRAAGTPFIGCLFVGLMIDHGKPSVVEFNARFGDPETQVVLPILDADVVELFASAARGALDVSSVRSTARAHACTVVLASKGYPDAFEKGLSITGLEDAEAIEGTAVYYAGVKHGEHGLVTSGGRVLAMTAVADTLNNARNAAYALSALVEFEGKTYRRDIAARTTV